jgi:hypothetical protein
MPIGPPSQHNALCASQLSSLLLSQRCALNLHRQLKLNHCLLSPSRLAPATLIGRTAGQALTAGRLP